MRNAEHNLFFSLDVEKDDEGSIGSVTNENGQQGAPAPETCIETTVPKQGQNLWYENIRNI